MHVRIYSKRAFEYFDHRYFNGSDTLEHGSYCKGHPGSLEDLEGCAGHLLERERITLSNSGTAERKGTIVILWATDNDDLTAVLLQYLLSFKDVLLVRVSHQNVQRFDVEPLTGMVDVAILEECDMLIGTTSSTFSFAAHTPGLM